MAGKKKNTKKAVTITPEVAEKFIRDIQETLAEANALETSEFFMDGIEISMQRAGIPRLKGKAKDLEVTFKGPKVKVKQ